MKIVESLLSIHELENLSSLGVTAFAYRCAKRAHTLFDTWSSTAIASRRKAVIESGLKLSERLCTDDDFRPSQRQVREQIRELQWAGSPVHFESRALECAALSVLKAIEAAVSWRTHDKANLAIETLSWSSSAAECLRSGAIGEGDSSSDAAAEADLSILRSIMARGKVSSIDPTERGPLGPLWTFLTFGLTLDRGDCALEPISVLKDDVNWKTSSLWLPPRLRSLDLQLRQFSSQEMDQLEQLMRAGTIIDGQ